MTRRALVREIRALLKRVRANEFDAFIVGLDIPRDRWPPDLHGNESRLTGFWQDERG